MDILDASEILYQPLPETFGKTPKQEDAETYIKSMLRRALPHSEKQGLENDLKWTFVLDKHSVKNSKGKKKANPKKFLTRKERFASNLHKLPKTGWDYGKLKGMRETWADYMRNCLDVINKKHKRVPTCADGDWQGFSANLAKCELVGAEVTVVRSRNTDLVNMRGTIVFETKETLQIVTPESKLKILIKKDSVFTFELDGMLFTFFGKYLATRPADRSSKKIKSFMFPDL